MCNVYYYILKLQITEINMRDYKRKIDVQDKKGSFRRKENTMLYHHRNNYVEVYMIVLTLSFTIELKNQVFF